MMAPALKSSGYKLSHSRATIPPKDNPRRFQDFFGSCSFRNCLRRCSTIPPTLRGDLFLEALPNPGRSNAKTSPSQWALNSSVKLPQCRAWRESPLSNIQFILKNIPMKNCDFMKQIKKVTVPSHHTIIAVRKNRIEVAFCIKRLQRVFFHPNPRAQL